MKTNVLAHAREARKLRAQTEAYRQVLNVYALISMLNAEDADDGAGEARSVRHLSTFLSEDGVDDAAGGESRGQQFTNLAKIMRPCLGCV